MLDLYARFCDVIKGQPQCREWIIAFSGGLDSTVLLHCAWQYAKAHHQLIKAVHVHHGLSPHADEWANHCQKVCQQWEIPCFVERIKVDGKGGLEASARDARYLALAKYVSAGAALLSAHHQDDQLETLLLALKRGSGVRGLSGMPACQPFADGYLLRPLLTFSQQVLRDYGKQLAIGWVDDESNQDCRFDRNFLRHQVIPALTARWPYFAQTASRSMAICQEQEQLLGEVAEQDWRQARQGEGIKIEVLKEYSVGRRNNVLRYWIGQQNHTMPSYDQLQRLWDEVALAKADSNPLLQWQGVSCRRFLQVLYLVKPYQPLGTLRLALNINQPLTLPEQLGMLHLTEQTNTEQGIRWPRVDEVVTVGFEVPAGCMLKPTGRAGSRRLKKLLQEYRVAPWQRGRLPILYYNDEVVAIAGLFICEPFVLAQGGLRLNWQVASD